MEFSRTPFLDNHRAAAKSRTPLTDKFVAEMEALIVPVELASHPRVIANLRQLMIDWADFARSLEELSNALRENHGGRDGEKVQG